MPEQLFVEERRRAIVEELRKTGRVSVRSLSETMHVSTVTIRQDLRALEEGGLLERTYGGAVSRTADTVLPELSFHVRQTRHRGAKSAIARAATAFVSEGDSIALDASTTAYALVPHLKALRKLTVLTNSLVIAQAFLDSPHITVLVPGGRLRRDSISVVDKPDSLPDINLNVGFMSGRGLTANEGITDVDADEVAVKQAIAARCVLTVMLVDSSKWGQVAPYTILRAQQIQRVISTEDAPRAQVECLRDCGVSVDLVPTEGRPVP